MAADHEQLQMTSSMEQSINYVEGCGWNDITIRSRVSARQSRVNLRLRKFELSSVTPFDETIDTETLLD